MAAVADFPIRGAASAPSRSKSSTSISSITWTGTPAMEAKIAIARCASPVARSAATRSFAFRLRKVSASKVSPLKETGVSGISAYGTELRV